jgi:hypothetical protein
MENPVNTRSVARAKQRLLTGLGTMLPFCRGTLSKTYLTCGKPSCACAGDPSRRHGPYYQWTVMEKGKVKHRTLKPDEAETVRVGIARRHLFEEWCRKYAAVVEEEALAGRVAGEKGGRHRRTPRR